MSRLQIQLFILLLIPILGLTYTNCSKVDFQNNDPASLQGLGAEDVLPEDDDNGNTDPGNTGGGGGSGSVAVICDPFGSSTSSEAGIVAKLVYYDGANASREIKTTVDMFTKGTRIEDTVVLFNTINVPTREFDEGFEVAPGEKLKNSRGETLFEYFGLEYNANLKLAAEDQEGDYQLGVISDDGSVVWVNSGSGLMEMVKNDRITSTRMECGGTIKLKKGDRLPMRMRYFQGPKLKIAVNLLWRRVTPGMQMSPSYCGTAEEFFVTDEGESDAKFQRAMRDGWKIIPAANFERNIMVQNTCPSK